MANRLSIDLVDEERVELEAYRRHHGLRSLNAAIKHMITAAAAQMRIEAARS